MVKGELKCENGNRGIWKTRHLTAVCRSGIRETGKGETKRPSVSRFHLSSKRSRLLRHVAYRERTVFFIRPKLFAVKKKNTTRDAQVTERWLMYMHECCVIFLIVSKVLLLIL